MGKVRSSYFTNAMFILLFLATAFVVCLPLFSKGIPTGHSWQFHMLRIEGLKDGLHSGQFPVRINPLFYNGYGYAIPQFYPDLFLYIPACFRILGFSITTSYKLFIGILSATCFLSTYYCVKNISKSKYAALIAAIVFNLSQYYLQNIYTRFDLGEVEAFVFLPFIVYGLYNFIYGKFDKPWLLVLGFAGLIHSHVISVILALLVCVVVSLFGIMHIITDREKLLKLLLCVAVTLGLTCSFWLPLIDQYRTNQFRLDFTEMGTLSRMAVSLSVIFAKNFTILNDVCSIGTNLLLLCLLRILVFAKPVTEEKRHMIDWCLIIGLSLTFATSKLFPWELFQSVLGNIQFPWRLYAMTSLFMAFAIGIICDILFQNRLRYIGILFILLLMYSSAGFIYMATVNYTDMPSNYYSHINNTYPPDGYEYTPGGLNRGQIMGLTSAPKVLTNTGDNLSYEKSGIKIKIVYNKDCKYIDVPLLYYKGYSAVFIDHAGKSKKINISMATETSTVRVDCSNISENGIIVVDYTGTIAHKLSLIVSMFMFISVIAIITLYHPEKLKIMQVA